jgi:hypothetical protein
MHKLRQIRREASVSDNGNPDLDAARDDVVSAVRVAVPTLHAQLTGYSSDRTETW